MGLPCVHLDERELPTADSKESPKQEAPTVEHTNLRNFLTALHPEAEAHLDEALAKHPEAHGVAEGLNHFVGQMQHAKEKAEQEMARTQAEGTKSHRCPLGFLRGFMQHAHVQAQKAQAACRQAKAQSPRDPGSPRLQPVKHWGVTCDVTGQHPLLGPRFHKRGENFDLCEAEFNKLTPEQQQAYERIDKPRHQMPCGVHRIPLCRFRPMTHRFRHCSRRPTAAEQERHGKDVATDRTKDDQAPAYAVDTTREEAWPEPPRHRCHDEVKEESIQETPEEAAERYALEEAVTIAEAVCGAEDRAREADVAAKCALLIDMGFGEEEVAEALEHTKGSLERAADFLFTRRQEREAEDAAFPAEWAESVEDLVEMGFGEQQATKAIKESQGDLKAAIKALVAAEREAS